LLSASASEAMALHYGAAEICTILLLLLLLYRSTLADITKVL